MSMMQAIRCKFGHHDWGPILGKIEDAHHECAHCGKVKPIKVSAPTRGLGGGITGGGTTVGK